MRPRARDGRLLPLLLASLIGGAATPPINTPGDRLGDAPPAGDALRPFFDLRFAALPPLSHEHGRQALQSLQAPGVKLSAAYVHAKPARTLPPWVPPGRPLPAFSWFSNELATYPNADAIAAAHVSPFSLADNALRITAAPAPQSVRDLLPEGYAQDYVSGALTTYPYAQTYGYFEIEARVPHGRGLWPAFWLLPMDLSWPPEIDVMEVLGQDPGTFHATVHSHAQGHHTMIGVPVSGPDLSAGFHRYGVDWGPERLRFYFDRKLVFSAPTPADMHKPFYMLVNLAVGGPRSWPGAPDATTVFPAHYDIREMLAWQRRAYLSDPAAFPAR